MKRFVLSIVAAAAVALGVSALSDQAAAEPVAAPAVLEVAAVPEAAPQYAIPEVVFVPAMPAPNGPPHTHTSGCESGNCFRWILQNGVVRQGPYANMVGETPLMLVLCAYRPGGPQTWARNTSPYGPFNNTGFHAYCNSPTYADKAGFAWPGPWAWLYLNG